MSLSGDPVSSSLLKKNYKIVKIFESQLESDEAIDTDNFFTCFQIVENGIYSFLVKCLTVMNEVMVIKMPMKFGNWPCRKTSVLLFALESIHP